MVGDTVTGEKFVKMARDFVYCHLIDEFVAIFLI